MKTVEKNISSTHFKPQLKTKLCDEILKLCFIPIQMIIYKLEKYIKNFSPLCSLRHIKPQAASFVKHILK